MDRILVAETPAHQLPPPTMLGGLGWQQLITRCFEDTTEAAFVSSDVWWSFDERRSLLLVHQGVLIPSYTLRNFATEYLSRTFLLAPQSPL
jgi:hypothetical protein